MRHPSSRDLADGPARRARGLAERPRAHGTLVLVAAALALCACAVRREMVITSQPEGAEVRIDGEPTGRTPLRLPFDHYGTRRFTFYLDGYVTDSQVVELSPPWYGVFPLDIVSEVLLPVGWRDRHRIHADLVPGTGAIPPPDLDSVLERAEQLRRAGPEGPPPTGEPGEGVSRSPRRAP
jgi:hypothetical protein